MSVSKVLFIEWFVQKAYYNFGLSIEVEVIIKVVVPAFSKR